MQKLREIQDVNSLGGVSGSERSSFQVLQKYGRKGGKRRKTGHSVIPEVRTYRAIEVCNTELLTPSPLYQDGIIHIPEVKYIYLRMTHLTVK